MSMKTMEELRITNMIHVSIILKMVDHTRTKPLGQLLQISVQIIGWKLWAQKPLPAIEKKINKK